MVTIGSIGQCAACGDETGSCEHRNEYRYKPYQKKKPDPVNHPQHYTSHPSGVECIQITEHMNFNLGNAMKYIWRADEKGDPKENIEKAIWYLQRELHRREKP